MKQAPKQQVLIKLDQQEAIFRAEKLPETKPKIVKQVKSTTKLPLNEKTPRLTMRPVVSTKPSKAEMRKPNKMKQRVRKLAPVYYSIYKTASQLLNYTYTIIEKFPKSEKNGLQYDIRSRTNAVVELLLEAISYSGKDNREQILRKIDIKLKMLGILIEYAYHKRYITDKNLDAWANRLYQLDNEVVVWARNIEKKGVKYK
jgi:hypothetical protein